ncbi:MAG: tetratricopeptide repeat protein, partial [Candidatus Sericytochromatia bacterium]|nr:tetratricopeptide repeat protein [Candidatus Tanganyikabacteria bacterium]
AWASNNLGVSYIERRQYAEAEICFRRAIFKDPEFATAYRNLGGLYLIRGQREEATRCLNRALRAQPGAETGREGFVYALAISAQAAEPAGERPPANLFD